MATQENEQSVPPSVCKHPTYAGRPTPRGLKPLSFQYFLKIIFQNLGSLYRKASYQSPIGLGTKTQGPLNVLRL